MRKGLILFAAIFGVVLSSCTTIRDTANTVTPESMVVNMTVADLDVDESLVSATVSWNWNPFNRISSKKSAADMEALRVSGADVLVEPMYEINKRGLFRGGSVTVIGHPATFKNFRPMTEKDAEIIATMKNKVAVATPAIPTTVPSFLDKLKPTKESKPKKSINFGEDNSYTSFIDLVYGFPSGSDIDGGWSIGVMYGNYKTWGWYVKASVDGSDDDTGFLLTGGAIRSLPKNFSVFAGLGVGKGLPDAFTIPVELGVKWNLKRFNIMLGYQYDINCNGDAGASKPFVGLGYNF